MIDAANIKVEYFFKKEWKVFLESFPEVQVRKTKRGHYYIFWANLRLEYVPYLDQLWIRNSLQKYYNAVIRGIPIGQENFDNYTLSNLIETIEFLCRTFKRMPKDFELFGKFEYGVNINVMPYQPLDIIDSYLSLGTTRINPFYADHPYHGKVIGKSCYLTEYRVKFYDKSRQAGIPIKGILRYEICNQGIGRLKKMLGKKKVTLLDLMEKDTLIILSNNLLGTYDNIKKLPIDQDEIPREIMLGLLAYSEPIMIKHDQKRLSQWQNSKQRAEYKSLMDKYTNSPESIHSWVRNMLTEKISQLIN